MILKWSCSDFVEQGKAIFFCCHLFRMIWPLLIKDPPPKKYSKVCDDSKKHEANIATGRAGSFVRALVFDREGYGPDFMLRMWEKRIACQTYSKYPGEAWLESEFHAQRVSLVSGHIVNMKLAERGTFLGEKLWVREIRTLTKRGHQTAIISTDYTRKLTASAAAMFARWSQENFFKYMREQ